MDTMTKDQTIPTLVFDVPEPELPTASTVAPVKEDPKLNETILTPEERKVVDEFCKKLTFITQMLFYNTV